MIWQFHLIQLDITLLWPAFNRANRQVIAMVKSAPDRNKTAIVKVNFRIPNFLDVDPVFLFSKKQKGSPLKATSWTTKIYPI